MNTISFNPKQIKEVLDFIINHHTLKFEENSRKQGKEKVQLLEIQMNWT